MRLPRSSALWSRDTRSGTLAFVLIAFLLCLVYRLAAILESAAAPDWLTMELNGVALAFYAAAIHALLRFPRRYLPVTLYLLLQSTHWGGPLPGYLPEPWPLLLYLLVSSVVASALFLHFALDVAAARVVRWLLYLPAFAMAASLALLPLGLAGAVQTVVAVCLLLATVLYPLAAVVILVRQFWDTPIRMRILGWLAPMIVAGAGAAVPGLDLFGRGYEPLNLLYLAVVPLITVVVRYRANGNAAGEGGNSHAQNSHRAAE